ncbi:MAG: glycosyltransferase [Acidobacteriota bacterium]|nr:glycosyltransferase [Acidobacteriota bacterium]
MTERLLSIDTQIQTPPASRARRVFFVLDSLNIGGTETQGVELARRLDPKRYEVTLACLRAQGPLLEKLTGSAVKLMEFHPNGGMNSLGGIYQLLRMATFLRRGKFDVVHTHDLWANLLGVPAAWLAQVPVIISSQRDLSHMDFYRTNRKRWLRKIQNMSNVVLANARAIRDGLVVEEGFSAKKVRVIYNGVDFERFARVARDRQRLFPGTTDKKLIVLVGNIHTDVKGHPLLIAAAVNVVREFPKTQFVFVGDGALRSELEIRVASLGLKKNVLFLGRRKDVPEILACSDIGILPSKAEGLPNAVLEYLAAGLPTIASDVGGNAEIIQDGVNGLLFPSEDPVALARALQRLLREPELAQRLASAGQEHVRKNFSFERMIEEMDSMYSELLGAHLG